MEEKEKKGGRRIGSRLSLNERCTRVPISLWESILDTFDMWNLFVFGNPDGGTCSQ